MAQREISEEDLRKRVRALLEEAHPDKVDQFTFRGKQYDHGLAWVHFPEGFGGLGLSPGMQAVVADELSQHAKTHYDDMMINAIGIGMGAPTVLTHGTDWMRKTLLRRIFTLPSRRGRVLQDSPPGSCEGTLIYHSSGARQVLSGQE